MQEKDNIVNCHTHIFTADHVPPFLAKTFVPAPFHLLLPLRLIVAVFRWWYRGPGTARFKPAYKRWIRAKTNFFAFLNTLYPLNIIAGYYVFLFVLLLICEVALPVIPADEGIISDIIHYLHEHLRFFFPLTIPFWLKVSIIAASLFFLTSIRNILLAVAKLLWKALGKLPGKQTKALALRYINIGRYAFHAEQKTIYSKLQAQYPKGTRFVVLPMDMEYMGAGKCKERYRDQMLKLARLKKKNAETLLPFVFVDPRRIGPVNDEVNYQAGDEPFFEWEAENGKVMLKPCFIKTYLESHQFAGIKIYPALGYYPFDERLLPLWKYAVDHNIPILTHCIRGTIFYRGQKEDGWNRHPIFQQAMGPGTQPYDPNLSDEENWESHSADTTYEKLVLPEMNNVDFCNNFTHPMNYLCLLNKDRLTEVIANASGKDAGKLKELFGYDAEQGIAHDLINLKICFGHYGGEDEWKRYFEQDRYNYSNQLAKYPDHGINFFTKAADRPSPGKPEQLWKYTDWYSIISSMMLQYDNVYADISYILHGDREVLPLLPQALQNKKVKEKILYGTDFFVVRNHKSDKNMLAVWMGGLSSEEFQRIAVSNPRKYLQRTV